MEKYVIITPVKDEGAHIKQTIESVLSQTRLPQEWVLVDDGSSDNTASIIEVYQRSYNWIKLLRVKTNHEQRMGGSKVVRAFNYGYQRLSTNDWEYIAKIDGDILLPKNYFEVVFTEFRNNPKLGICGGRIVNKYSDNRYLPEESDPEFVRGALKTLKRNCWFDIGGFKEFWFWDGLDILEANYSGYLTRSIDLDVIHFRPTSQAYNLISHSFKSGYEYYKMGTNFVYIFFKSIKLMFKKPFVLSGITQLLGYLFAALKKEEVYFGTDFVHFVNKFQKSKIKYKIIKKLKKVFTI